MVAAMVGMVILFFLDVASLGVFGAVVTVAGIVAAVGVGRYLLWERVPYEACNLGSINLSHMVRAEGSG